MVAPAQFGQAPRVFKETMDFMIDGTTRKITKNVDGQITTIKYYFKDEDADGKVSVYTLTFSDFDGASATATPLTTRYSWTRETPV